MDPLNPIYPDPDFRPPPVRGLEITRVNRDAPRNPPRDQGGREDDEEEDDTYEPRELDEEVVNLASDADAGAEQHRGENGPDGPSDDRPHIDISA